MQLRSDLSFVASVLPAYWVSRKELKEEANLLLLPKPPVSGSKISLGVSSLFGSV